MKSKEETFTDLTINHGICNDEIKERIYANYYHRSEVIEIIGEVLEEAAQEAMLKLDYEDWTEGNKIDKQSILSIDKEQFLKK